MEFRKKHGQKVACIVDCLWFLINYWTRRNIGEKPKDIAATICVLTSDSSLNGQPVRPYLFIKDYLETRRIKYHFNIIHCDFHIICDYSNNLKIMLITIMQQILYLFQIWKIIIQFKIIHSSSC